MEKMKVLIVSDTHGRHAGIEEAIEREYPFQKLIHLGDAEGYEVYIEELAKCPIEIVAGNNDFFSNLPDEKIIFIEDFCAMITHGHAYGVSMGYQNIRNEGRVRGVDAVMFGHTHRPLLEEDDDLILLNPGSLSYPRQKGRQRSYIVMEKERGKKPTFEIRYLDE